MKEVIAIIRINMINQTKAALANAGFPAFSCRKCLGRGKKGVVQIPTEAIIAVEGSQQVAAESSVEYHSPLFAKRAILVIVEDDQVEDIVRLLIETNQTGNPGDGKIFVLPMREAYRVRTGEATTEAY